MRLGWKARRRLSLLVLLVALPAYIVAAVTVVGWFDRPPVAVEFLVYVVLGIAWALPLRIVFLSVARPDPDAKSGGPRAQAGGNPRAGPGSGGEQR